MDGSEGFVEKGESLPLPRKVGAAAIPGNSSRSRFCLVDIPPVRLCGSHASHVCPPRACPTDTRNEWLVGQSGVKKLGQVIGCVQFSPVKSELVHVVGSVSGVARDAIPDLRCPLSRRAHWVMCSMCRGPGAKVTLGEC